MTSARLSRPTLLALAAVLILGFLAIAYFPAESDESGDVADYLIASLLSIAIAAGLLFGLVPRLYAGERRTDRVALVIAVLALLSAMVFWTGLPFALCAAAVALAAPTGALAEGWTRSSEARAALIVAGVALVLTIVGCLFG